MAETNTPHDDFFKRLFGNLAVTTDFLRSYLPPDLLAQLALETLRLEKESFVDPELRKHYCDLLFSVKHASGLEVFIFLLLEHKSWPDKWVALQLLRYILQFWEQQRAEGRERLPPIIPIVFYHGRERWNVPRRLSGLVEPTDIGEWRKYLLDFEYELRDVSLRGGAEIKGGPKLRAGLQLMRYIFSDDLGRRLPEIFRQLRELSWADALEFLRSLLAYLSSAAKKVKKEDIRQAMEATFPQPEFDKSALFIQEWMDEGRQEGEHKALSALVLNQIRVLLGEPDEATASDIRALPTQRLAQLGEALLHFKSQADLHDWLLNHTPAPQVGD